MGRRQRRSQGAGPAVLQHETGCPTRGISRVGYCEPSFGVLGRARSTFPNRAKKTCHCSRRLPESRTPTNLLRTRNPCRAFNIPPTYTHFHEYKNAYKMFHWNIIPSVPAGTLGTYNSPAESYSPRDSLRETNEESGTHSHFIHSLKIAR